MDGWMDEQKNYKQVHGRNNDVMTALHNRSTYKCMGTATVQSGHHMLWDSMYNVQEKSLLVYYAPVTITEKPDHSREAQQRRD
eukprot:scaffold567834_cov36-Prasinocladus_malaysianus.AAC.1